MKSILIVDDSPTLLMSMGSVLERGGYSVTKASSGEDAIRALRTRSFNGVITDYNMPGMNGVEMIRQARGLPGARFTPMLLLTTESEQKKRDEAKEAGATGWLVKPVAPDKLLAVLKQVLPGA